MSNKHSLSKYRYLAPQALTSDTTSHQVLWIRISQRTGLNQKWASDNSYIWTSDGWLYLAVILDLYSPRVIGWAVSDRMKKDLSIRALDVAVALRQPPENCIHQTDRGAQYRSNEFQKRLSNHGIEVTMSGKGNCYDNFMAETFFKSIKVELIWRIR